jgi:catechol 2,3-dioxygenase-like lactoylglutathione lyase family enzyme
MQLTELTRFVDDVEAATDFYHTFTGSEPASSWPGGAVFELDGVTVLLHEPVEHDQAPGEDHPAFAVDDVEAACERLADEGLEVEWPPGRVRLGSAQRTSGTRRGTSWSSWKLTDGAYDRENRALSCSVENSEVGRSMCTPIRPENARSPSR